MIQKSNINISSSRSYDRLLETPDVKLDSYGSVDDGSESDIETNDRNQELSIIIEKVENGNWLDNLSIIANTINALLGVSLFAMPWGFQQAGLLGGFLLLALVAGMSFETARLLLLAQRAYFNISGDVKSYPDLAACALGEVWRYVVFFATIISCLGGCTGYIIFFGETMGQLFSISPQTVILAATIPLILLSWIRSVRELTVFTVFGVISLIVAGITIVVDGFRNSTNVDRIPLFAPQTTWNFIGPVTFLFTIHYFILAMGEESLEIATRPWSKIDSDRSAIAIPMIEIASNTNVTRSIGIAYLVSLILITAIGGSAFAMYREVPLVRYAAYYK